jgi:TolA-binding protein
MKKHILFLLFTSLLAACASTVSKTPATKPIETEQTSPTNKSTAAIKVVAIKSIDAIEYLTFAEDFSNLTADAQKQALAHTNQALTINPNDLLHRMKLVMIYGLPSSTIPDTMKAQQLLQIVLQEDILANSQLAFANLLFDYLAMVNKPIKTTIGEPKRADNLQQKNEALQTKLDATQQKLEAAQQKLDELRKIEKSMGEREALPKK